MYEVKTKLNYCKGVVDKFNKKSNIWKAKILGILTKNINADCQTIKIKEKNF